MLRKFVLLATILIGSVSSRGQSPLMFSCKDLQAMFDANASLRDHCELVCPYNGSDENAFGLRWANIQGNLPLLQFTSTATANPRSLWGWVHIGPNIVHPKPVHLMLVDSDTYRQTISETTITAAGDYVLFRLPLSAQPPSDRYTLLVHVPDVDTGVMFCGVQLSENPPSTQPLSVVPATHLQPLPAENLVCQQVHRFAGNDFDPHEDSALDFLGTNPVTVLTGNQTREINILVPSSSPARTIPILALDDPAITSSDYAIAGDISYASVHAGFTMTTEQLSITDNLSSGDVEGTGYLEMISDFSDGTSAVTQALGDSGPLRLIRGRSGPRPILLPYHSNGKKPIRLRMNLVMPGRATIALSNLRLVQYVPPVVVTASRGAMLLSPRLIWVPVIVLPFFSLVALLEPLVRRGRGRSFVIGWIWTFFILAQMGLAWTMAAWGHGLPMGEVSPALLVSVLILCCALLASRRMSRRYRDVELRKMQLMDAV